MAVGGEVPRWADLATVLVVLLFTAGAAVALVHPTLLVSSAARVDAATRVYAGYVISRDGALALVLAALPALHARRLLAGALVLAALVQVLDIVVDVAGHRLLLVPGLVLLTALILAAATRMSPEPLWSRSAWRDGA